LRFALEVSLVINNDVSLFVIVRLDRTIQYSETSMIEPKSRGILDTRIRGYDGLVRSLSSGAFVGP
jgi:hypothetical protein